ncbi:MAG: hypothetical protein ACYDB3_09070 [Acidimicrobiales bacterium]
MRRWGPQAAAVVIATGAVVSSCGGAYGGATVGQQVASWARESNLSSALGAIRADMSRISTMTDAAHAAAMRTDCDVLVTDTLAANEQLPTPDDLLTTLLSMAYASAASAGHDCFSRAGEAGARLARSADERRRATTELIQAEARYDALTSTLPGGKP